MRHINGVMQAGTKPDPTATHLPTPTSDPSPTLRLVFTPTLPHLFWTRSLYQQTPPPTPTHPSTSTHPNHTLSTHTLPNLFCTKSSSKTYNTKPWPPTHPPATPVLHQVLVPADAVGAEERDDGRAAKRKVAQLLPLLHLLRCFCMQVCVCVCVWGGHVGECVVGAWVCGEGGLWVYSNTRRGCCCSTVGQAGGSKCRQSLASQLCLTFHSGPVTFLGAPAAASSQPITAYRPASKCLQKSRTCPSLTVHTIEPTMVAPMATYATGPNTWQRGVVRRRATALSARLGRSVCSAMWCCFLRIKCGSCRPAHQSRRQCTALPCGAGSQLGSSC